jgi:hypothetical protein
MDDTTELATQIPVINYRDGFNCSSENIDKESFLKKSDITHGNKRVMVPHSGYLTIPFQGDGQGSMEDNRLKFKYGDDKRSERGLEYVNRNNVQPLLERVETELKTPSNFVQDLNYDMWVRGGFPTRSCKKMDCPNIPMPVVNDVN